jgi:hypothetical protein
MRRSTPDVTCSSACAHSRARQGPTQRDALGAQLALARADDLRVVTSAATLVEVIRPRINRPALERTLSRLVVEPVTEALARHAAALLSEAGLHGHEHAIDAVFRATALAAPGPVTALTSEPEDLAALCRDHVTVVQV